MSRNIQILRFFKILTQCDKLQQQITHSLDEFQKNWIQQTQKQTNDINM